MAHDPEFRYSDVLPASGDVTPYRLVTTDGGSTFEVNDRTFLRVAPEAIRRLSDEAMPYISHYRRWDMGVFLSGWFGGYRAAMLAVC